MTLLIRQSRRITAIKAGVASHFGIPPAWLASRSRRGHVVQARQFAMYFAREITGASYPAIGRAFGGMHHTTVMYACEKIKTWLLDVKVMELVRELNAKLEAVSA